MEEDRSDLFSTRTKRELKPNRDEVCSRSNPESNIVSGTDEILWVPGLPPAEKAKLFESSERVIRLTYTYSPT